MAKGNPRNCRDVYRLCLFLWWDVTTAFSEAGYAVPDLERDSSYAATDRETLLRLAALADFYKYQRDVLCVNAAHVDVRLESVRFEFLKLTACVVERPAFPTDERTGAGTDGRRRLNASRKRCAHAMSDREPVHGREVKWSRLGVSFPHRSYYTKMIKTFQQVKTVGHPMLTIGSSWELNAYYSLATAYTTDCPLELAAACFPELIRALPVIHNEQYHKLRTLAPKTQTLLYGVLNCHINWVDHNHSQIVVVPQSRNDSPVAKTEGDLRCSRCLKNQTFHSSEVRGNPRNIDVEFDLDTMSFRSSCCSATVVNVPLRTASANTCTYTEMKQMYTSCPRCAQTIFSEVLVDIQTLYSRCVTCESPNLTRQ